MKQTSSKVPDALPGIIQVDINNLKAIEGTALRRKAEPLTFPLTDEDKRDIHILTMQFQSDKDIANLSAPQIGISKRIIIFSFSLKKDEDLQHRLWINPTYEKATDEMKNIYESCASIDCMIGKAKRYSSIRYTAFDVDGNLIEGVAKGYPGRMIQHEVDHLDGILFIDRVKPGKVITFQKHLDRLNEWINRGRPGFKFSPIRKKKKSRSNVSSSP